MAITPIAGGSRGKSWIELGENIIPSIIPAALGDGAHSA
jgi:hypothetical protein